MITWIFRNIKIQITTNVNNKYSRNKSEIHHTIRRNDMYVFCARKIKKNLWSSDDKVNGLMFLMLRSLWKKPYDRTTINKLSALYLSLFLVKFLTLEADTSLRLTDSFRHFSVKGVKMLNCILMTWIN